MEKKNLIATFLVDGKRFSVYGEYEIESSYTFDYKSNERIDYKYPEFYDLSATKVVDGAEQDYVPSGTNWIGRKYVVADMIQSLLAALIRQDDSYTKIFLDKGLQEIMDEYINEKEIVLTTNDKKISKRVLAGDMFCLYQLVLVTDNFMYYICDDSALMLRTKDHSIVSDNYFASEGYFESIENIRLGEEKLLWGEIPEEE